MKSLVSTRTPNSRLLPFQALRRLQLQIEKQMGRVKLPCQHRSIWRWLWVLQSMPKSQRTLLRLTSSSPRLTRCQNRQSGACFHWPRRASNRKKLGKFLRNHEAKASSWHQRLGQRWQLGYPPSVDSRVARFGISGVLTSPPVIYLIFAMADILKPTNPKLGDSKSRKSGQFWAGRSGECGKPCQPSAQKQWQ